MSVQQAVDLARSQYGDITYCVHKKSWEECISCGMLWFNDVNGSTHVIKLED
jgi:hypothetical protein